MGEGEVGEVFSLEEEGGSAWMLLDWGASVVSVVVQTPNKNHAELTVGFSDFARYRQGHPYFGSTVGRVAGRISQARFKIGDRWFSLDRNEGACHLHGGAQGFAWKRWKSGIVSTAYGDGIRFERESPSGEGGYPGNLTVAVTYTLIDPWTLSAVFSAESDALTPVNMTNHAYWNLSGEETVARHELRLFTRDFLEAGPDLIPTGNRIPMAGSRLDFTVSRPLGEIIAESGATSVSSTLWSPCMPHRRFPASRAGPVPLPAFFTRRRGGASKSTRPCRRCRCIPGISWMDPLSAGTEGRF